MRPSTERAKSELNATRPQPNSTSAANADRRKLRFGRAEARPSEESQKFSARRDEFELVVQRTQRITESHKEIGPFLSVVYSPLSPFELQCSPWFFSAHSALNSKKARRKCARPANLSTPIGTEGRVIRRRWWRLSGLRGRLPEGCPPGPRASCVFSLLFVFRGACVFE